MSKSPGAWTSLLPAAIAVAGGFFVGWGLKAIRSSHPSQSSFVQQASAATGSRSSSRSGLAPRDSHGPGSRPHDLRTLQAGLERKGYLPEEAARSIERMGTNQLKDICLKLIAPQDGKSPMTAEDEWLRYSFVNLAASELYRRDPDGSIEWADKAGPAANSLYDAVLAKGMALDPVWAKPYLEAKREARGDDWAHALIWDAYKGAAERGADALLEVEGMFAAEQAKAGRGGPPFFSPGDYADHFDFGTFLAKTSVPSYKLDPAIVYWAASDPEAAFGALKDQTQRNPFAFSWMVTGFANLNGYDEAAKWAVAKLDELPADQRFKLASSLAGIGDAFPQKIQIFMSALSNPDDKVAYASGTSFPLMWVDSNSDLRTVAGIQALQLLGSEELQAQAISQNIKNLGNSLDDTNRPKLEQRLTETMETLHFSEAGKAAVLSSLK